MSTSAALKPQRAPLKQKAQPKAQAKPPSRPIRRCWPIPPMPQGGEAYGAWFDAKAADAAIAWIEAYCRHTEAEWYGRPFKLADWQITDVIRPLFGWKRADGTRLIRVFYLEIPRKNGKTELAAAIALCLLLHDGEYGGQGYSMAVDEDQAKIVFAKMAVMISLDEDLSSLADAQKKMIIVPQLLATFRPLSSRPGGKHGFSPSFAIGDEIHQWPDGELHDVVHKGTAARRQPVEILITTAGEPDQGYGAELHEKACAWLNGIFVDPTFHAKIYAADPDDDWQNPKTWARANPNYGISVKPDYLESEVRAAQGNPRKIAAFKRYHLNIWAAQAEAGLDMEAWRKAPSGPLTLNDLKGRRIWAGLDMSSITDLTALAGVLESQTTPGVMDVFAHFWLPKEGLADRIKRDRVPYDKWAAAGYLTLTDGNVVDYDAVKDFICGQGGLAQTANIIKLGIDRWNSTQTSTQLMAENIPVETFGQGFASMSAPSKELERLVLGQLLNHGHHPVLNHHAQCLSFASDPADNLKPVKPDRRRTPKRIDGMVATIMGLGLYLVHKPPPPPITGSLVDTW